MDVLSLSSYSWPRINVTLQKLLDNIWTLDKVYLFRKSDITCVTFWGPVLVRSEKRSKHCHCPLPSQTKARLAGRRFCIRLVANVNSTSSIAYISGRNKQFWTLSNWNFYRYYSENLHQNTGNRYKHCNYWKTSAILDLNLQIDLD